MLTQECLTQEFCDSQHTPGAHVTLVMRAYGKNKLIYSWTICRLVTGQAVGKIFSTKQQGTCRCSQDDNNRIKGYV